jgi:hypothetical protein
MMREMEIWREGEAEREEWHADRIAEAEVRQEQRAARPVRGRAPGAQVLTGSNVRT